MKTYALPLAGILVIIAGACTDSARPGDVGSPAAAERFAGKLEVCEWPGYEGQVLCGTLQVPEDRQVPDGRLVGLRVVLLPAIGDGEVAADAVTFLAGGGVVPATRYVPFFAGALERLRSGRDIVLVDQRGTGGSNPLHCELPEPFQVEGGEAGGEVYQAAYLEALRSCRAETGERADPSLYTTSHAAADLDAVREWLGYDSLTLWGASYGTKVARVYMRRYPDRVRAAVLHGVVPIEFSMWPDLFPSADSTLDALFALCASDPECAQAYPDLGSRFVDLMAGLERDPVPLRVAHGGSVTDSVTVSFDGRSLAAVVAGALRSSRSARGLPALVDAMSRGDFSHVARMQRPGAPPAIPRGVYLSIACAEEIPRLTEADMQRARGVSRLGSGEWLDEERAECGIWGSGSVPPDFWDPVVSEAPVLLVTGSEDYITPPGYAESVAAHLPNSSVRLVPQRGHDDIDSCVSAVIEEFLILGRDTDPGLGCPEDTGPLPFDLPPGRTD
jgi:pimeloyl-ACP methyl ester carboxylesterase